MGHDQTESLRQKIDDGLEIGGAIAGAVASAPIMAGRYILGRLDGENHSEAERACDKIGNTAAEIGGEIGKNHLGTVLSGLSLMVGLNLPRL